MAGYMTKLQGYVFEGELKNGASAAMKNGSLCVPKVVSGELVMGLPAADASTKQLCKEVTTIYDNIPAYRFMVNKVNNPVYLVENGYEAGTNLVYDNTVYETPVGEFIRAHALLVGEEFVTDQVTGTPEVGTEYGVKADGTIG